MSWRRFTRTLTDPIRCPRDQLTVPPQSIISYVILYEILYVFYIYKIIFSYVCVFWMFCVCMYACVYLNRWHNTRKIKTETWPHSLTTSSRLNVRQMDGTLASLSRHRAHRYSTARFLIRNALAQASQFDAPWDPLCAHGNFGCYTRTG